MDLNTLKNLSNTSKWLILGVIVFGGAYLAGSQSKNSELDDWRDKYKQYYEEAQTTKQAAEQLKKTSDSLAALAHSKDAKIDSLRNKADRLSRDRANLGKELGGLESELDKLGSVIPAIDSIADTTAANRIKLAIQTRDTIINKQKTTIKLANEEIVTLRSVADSQKIKLGLLNQSLLTSNQRGDSLQSVVDKLPTKPPRADRFLGFIPMPSRTTVAVVSLVAGTYLGTQLKK